MLSGPFEWVAVKSKYFVAALLAIDSASSAGQRRDGRAARRCRPNRSGRRCAPGLPVAASGVPSRSAVRRPHGVSPAAAIGHDFYDINPYGWPGFRTIIRPVAVAARWLLVWMHDHLTSPTAWCWCSSAS